MFINTLIISMIFWLPSLAHGQYGDDNYDDPAVVGNTGNANSNEPKTSFRFGYGYLNESSELATKEGFKNTLPMSTGFMRSFEARYNPSKQTSLRLRFRNQTVIFKDVPETSPSDIDVQRSHLRIGMQVMPFGKGAMQNVSLGFGVYRAERHATETAPNTLLADHQQLGLGLALGWDKKLSKDLDLETNAEMEMPLVFKELNVKTGPFYYGMNYEFSGMFAYTAARWQVLSVGLALRQSRAAFSGTGQQGTVDGRDNQMDWWVPLEFRMRF